MQAVLRRNRAGVAQSDDGWRLARWVNTGAFGCYWLGWPADPSHDLEQVTAEARDVVPTIADLLGITGISLRFDGSSLP
ncbi:hypothetical protein [Halorubrum sp. FL23]|uniref:hypothetical protein n=1 Tax=Halorubrum sp. FL23 TaxID=3458704 RepID=UPI004034010B